MSYSYVKPEIRECFENGTNDTEILERINNSLPNENATVRRITQSVILVVSSFATIITIIFIIAVIKAIKNRQVSRKCYILILTRSFGDFLTSFCFVLYSILLLSLHSNYTTTELTVLKMLVFIMNAALWSEMISYNLLSGIKLYSVVKPLHYRNNFTFKRCLYLSSISGIVFFTILSIDLIRYITCGEDNCGILFDQIQNGFYTGTHFFTVIFFILTAIFVYRATKFPDGQSTKKTKFPFSTYAIMLGTFIFFYSFLIANDIFFSHIYQHLSYCFKLLEGPTITAIKESIYILFLFRIFIDPIINCFIDKKINSSVKSLFSSFAKAIEKLKNYVNKLKFFLNGRINGNAKNDEVNPSTTQFSIATKEAIHISSH